MNDVLAYTGLVFFGVMFSVCEFLRGRSEHRRWIAACELGSMLLAGAFLLYAIEAVKPDDPSTFRIVIMGAVLLAVGFLGILVFGRFVEF